MNRFFSIILLVILALASSSCKKKSAPILNHSRDIYNKQTLTKYDNYKKDGAVTSVSRSSEKELVVAEGDTLYSVSRKYQVPLRDLIETNNLSAPYSLKKGTVLKIPQPIYYRVQNGDTLYSISRANNMSVNEVIALNDMKEPYSVKVGSLIRIKNPEAGEKIQIENKKLPNTKNAPQKEEDDEPVQVAKPAPRREEPQGGFINNIFTKNNKFIWPLSGTVISKFGPKKGGLYNDGVNIKAKEGSPVHAAEDGTIAYAGNELKGYGNLIILKHEGGWITAYGHLGKTKVVKGQKIVKGHSIATVGTSGNVDSPQLYFGLRKGRDAVNPENYIKLKR